ncbi:hypothetical protein SRB5_12310 [Streptomyces sp. RB5]|uniref:Uncharacterized protein n=1 Tax=Streptomyces smaragdinus TaxID=2585196 RepID=A0A7K0CCD7_9ACTN|nr:hypothetical protein [Streptomyces smaragdinus]MQY11117.1 hypothetical protein [Streptomyces smaragdinus]
MRVQISVPDDPAALAQLHASLKRHPRTRRLAAEPATRPGDGHMGALDVLNLILPNTAAYGSLAVAVATWLGTRRTQTAPVSVTLQVNGAPVTVSGGSPQDIERILRSLDERARSTAPDAPGREPR